MPTLCQASLYRTTKAGHPFQKYDVKQKKQKKREREDKKKINESN